MFELGDPRWKEVEVLRLGGPSSSSLCFLLRFCVEEDPAVLGGDAFEGSAVVCGVVRGCLGAVSS